MKSAFLRFLVLSSIGFVLGALLAFGQSAAHGLASPAASTAQAVEGGPSIGGPFSLTDHHGKPVTEKSWPGKYKLVFFGFTSCPDTCPAVMQKVSAVMEKADPKGEKIVPLFITVDPETDTAAVLARYVEAYNPHIVGLTGTEKQISAAESAYKVYAAKNPEKGTIDHSSYVYLLSPQDKFIEAYSVEAPAQSVIDKIKQSVK